MTDQIRELADRIRLEMTCSACPEQYDAMLDGEMVGYLRLRHGWFYVEYPECGGRTILEGQPKGDGIFEPDERDEWLTRAKVAIAGAILHSSANLIPSGSPVSPIPSVSVPMKGLDLSRKMAGFASMLVREINNDMPPDLPQGMVEIDLRIRIDMDVVEKGEMVDATKGIVILDVRKSTTDV